MQFTCMGLPNPLILQTLAEMHEGIPLPKLSQNDPVPPNLMDVIDHLAAC